MMVLSLFIIDLMGLFFYTKIGSIISIGDLPTINIIEPFLKTNLHFENHQKNGIMVGKDSAKSNSAFRIKG